MTIAINELLSKNIIYTSPESIRSGFLAPMFLRQKPNGSIRPIFNLKPLNQYIKLRRFRLINHYRIPGFLQEDDFLATIDLSEAYCHVPVKEGHRRFLSFHFEGKIYSWKCLPFGLASAPQAFSQLTNWVAELLRKQGAFGTPSSASSSHSGSHSIEELTQENSSNAPHGDGSHRMVDGTSRRGELLRDRKMQDNFVDRRIGLGTRGAYQLKHSPSTGMESPPRTWHIKRRELHAVFWTISRNPEIFRDRSVTLLTDSTVVAGQIRNQGGLRSPSLLEETWNLLHLVSSLNAQITPVYNPSLYNSIADSLSRNSLPPEWHLSRAAVDPIFRRWGFGRSLRIKEVESGRDLCVTRPSRQECAFHRCALKTLGVQNLMGFPPTSFDTADLEPPERSLRNLLCCGTQVDENVLAARSAESSSDRRPHQNTESGPKSSGPNNGKTPSERTRHPAGSVEDTGWKHHIAELSTSERNLLNSAWRPPTKATYCQPWKRWTKWAKEKGVDHLRPSCEAVARFLAFLHTELHLSPASIALRYYLDYLEVLPSITLITELHLSPASIALHKSVVATWVDPELSSSISSHPLVQKMVKGINASQPRKECRRIWDIQQLRVWVEQNPPSPKSFFEVSRHLAIILALSSGRRIHDLTLLHVDEAHLQRIDDDIILWPSFGSKTDNTSKTQSGWRLSSNIDPLWDPVKWVELFLELRKQRCGSIPTYLSHPEMRKHLKNKRLESLKLLGLDRIIDLQFGTGEAEYHIIVELYDRGNIVLTDKDYIILNVLRPHSDGEEVRFYVREKYPVDLAKVRSGAPTQEMLYELFTKEKYGEQIKKILVPQLGKYNTFHLELIFSS
ncbi:hypothetical protein M8J76_011662 [Diaphorina citri]|nr:hypothetical protein M8J76_011662 [Diaphorina citri]